jgi:hypothetical protein
VHVTASTALIGEIRSVRINNIDRYSLFGDLEDAPAPQTAAALAGVDA